MKNSMPKSLITYSGLISWNTIWKTQIKIDTMKRPIMLKKKNE